MQEKKAGVTIDEIALTSNLPIIVGHHTKSTFLNHECSLFVKEKPLIATEAGQIVSSFSSDKNCSLINLLHR
uniref:Uncharacterized protein n=1 Tax=Lotus japonicus TaxID=34305 RepID=I3S2M0_LOTJA|nr:unknown [Lotus japonicus]